MWLDFKSGIGQSGSSWKQIALIKYQGVKSLASSHLNPHQEADAEFKLSCSRLSMKAGQQLDKTKQVEKDESLSLRF